MEILEKLKDLISNYYSVKSLMDNYKKETDAMNKEIKTEMKELGKSTIDLEEEGLVCELKTQERKSFNEPELISYLKQLNVELPGVIEVVEKINEDALENAIYNGKVNPTELKQFIQIKKVDVLKVKKKK